MAHLFTHRRTIPMSSISVRAVLVGRAGGHAVSAHAGGRDQGWARRVLSARQRTSFIVAQWPSSGSMNRLHPPTMPSAFIARSRCLCLAAIRPNRGRLKWRALTPFAFSSAQLITTLHHPHVRPRSCRAASSPSPLIALFVCADCQGARHVHFAIARHLPCL